MYHLLYAADIEWHLMTAYWAEWPNAAILPAVFLLLFVAGRFVVVLTAFGHINKVKLRRARLFLGLVTTFGGYIIPVFSRKLSPTQADQPCVGRRNKYPQWFRPPLGKKRRVLRSSWCCDQDCWHTGWSRLKALAVNLNRLCGQYSGC